MADFETVNEADALNSTSRVKINNNFGKAINKDGSVDFTGEQSMGTNKLVGVTDPTAAQDAATKNYVDTADKKGVISGCSVYRGSAQTFTHNVEEKIEFDTENYDALGEYDKDTNYRFTCTKPGRYAIYAQTIANESDDIVNYISIKKNGGNIAEGRIRYSTGSYFSSSAYIAVELAVNDYIEFYNLFYNYTDGGNVAIYNASSRSFATINKIA